MSKPKVPEPKKCALLRCGRVAVSWVNIFYNDGFQIHGGRYAACEVHLGNRW